MEVVWGRCFFGAGPAAIGVRCSMTVVEKVGWPAWIWERDSRRKPGPDSSGPTKAASVNIFTLSEVSSLRSHLRILVLRGKP